MKWLISLKKEYEKQVLGLCLEVSHYAVADIVKPDNFSDDDQSHHAKIYKTILSFSVGDPVNIMTVSQRYKRDYGDNLWSSYYITNLLNSVYSSDPRYYALTLLELDIRLKLLKHLTSQQQFLSNARRYDESEIYKQCIALIDNKQTDLFEGLEICLEFVKKYVPNEYSVLYNFVEALPKVSDRIKSLAKIENAINQFESLCRTISDDQSKEIALKAKDIFIESLLIGKKSPKFINQVNKIHETI